MRLAELVRASRAVAATPARREKVALLADAVRALAREERRVGVAWLAGDLARGRIGVGWAALRALVLDVHPRHLDRADLVAAAVAAALTREPA